MTDQRNVPTYSKANNRITSVGGQSYSYDDNGNITSTGTGTGTTAYTWDAEGRMLSATASGQTEVDATYDALGRMVEQNRNGSYTQFVYDPMGDKLGKMSGQALSAARVPLPGGGVAIYASSSDVDRYWHSDWQGSVRFVSSQGRALDYDNAKAPYGEEYAATGPTPTGVFAGLVGDTGGGSPLWDATFREYDHTQGRWLSPDPAGLAAADPSNPQSWNRYAYVVNNPTSLIDPLGLDNVKLLDPSTCDGIACNPPRREGRFGGNPIDCGTVGFSSAQCQAPPWLWPGGEPIFPGGWGGGGSGSGTGSLGSGTTASGPSGASSAGVSPPFGDGFTTPQDIAQTVPWIIRISVWAWPYIVEGGEIAARASGLGAALFTALMQKGDAVPIPFASGFPTIQELQRYCTPVGGPIIEPSTSRPGWTSEEQEYDCRGVTYTIHCLVSPTGASRQCHVRPGLPKGGGQP